MAIAHALVLVVSALGWLVAEALMAARGIGAASGTLATVTLMGTAAGVWALKDDVLMGRAGRVGIVMVSFGTLSLAMVMIIILTSGGLGALESGEITYGDMVWTPFYLLALVFLIAGLVGFALHYRQGTDYPGWLAPAFWALAGLTVLRIVMADLAIVHASANMGLAALLALLGAAAARSAAQPGHRAEEPRGSGRK